MRLSSFVIAGALSLGLLGGGVAQALTYDSHISRNGDGSAGFQQDPDDAMQAHFGITDGTDDNQGPTSPFLGSSDHNFSPPDVQMPFGGVIQGQNR